MTTDNDIAASPGIPPAQLREEMDAATFAFALKTHRERMALSQERICDLFPGFLGGKQLSRESWKNWEDGSRLPAPAVQKLIIDHLATICSKKGKAKALDGTVAGFEIVPDGDLFVIRRPDAELPQKPGARVVRSPEPRFLYWHQPLECWTSDVRDATRISVVKDS